MFKRELCGADASAVFKRDEFGLTAGKDYGFSMDVNLRIQMEAVQGGRSPKLRMRLFRVWRWLAGKAAHVPAGTPARACCGSARRPARTRARLVVAPSLTSRSPRTLGSRW